MSGCISPCLDEDRQVAMCGWREGGGGRRHLSCGSPHDLLVALCCLTFLSPQGRPLSYKTFLIWVLISIYQGKDSSQLLPRALTVTH